MTDFSVSILCGVVRLYLKIAEQASIHFPTSDRQGVSLQTVLDGLLAVGLPIKSLSQASRAMKSVRESIDGTEEEGYMYARSVLDRIASLNPGTVVDFQVTPSGTFRRLYLSLGQNQVRLGVGVACLCLKPRL